MPGLGPLPLLEAPEASAPLRQSAVVEGRQTGREQSLRLPPPVAPVPIVFVPRQALPRLSMRPRPAAVAHQPMRERIAAILRSDRRTLARLEPFLAPPPTSGTHPR